MGLSAACAYFVKSDGQLVAVLPPARLQSADWRRRGPPVIMLRLIWLLDDGPLEIHGGGVTWRVENAHGFADWLELVYEAGEPLGISARVFDRPRVNNESLAGRLMSEACVVAQVELPPLGDEPLTLPDLLEVGLDAPEPYVVPDEAQTCAFVYRAVKIWASING